MDQIYSVKPFVSTFRNMPWYFVIFEGEIINMLLRIVTVRKRTLTF